MSVELEDLRDLTSQYAGWDQSGRMAYSFGKHLAHYATLAAREGKTSLAQKFWAKLRTSLTHLRSMEMEEYDERAKEMQKGAQAGSKLGNAGRRVDRDKAGRRKPTRARRDLGRSDVQDLREITERHQGWFSDRAIAYDYGYALAMTAAAAQRAGNTSRAERFWTTLARADKALAAKPALVAQLRSGAMTGAARGRTGRAASGTQLRAVTRRDPKRRSKKKTAQWNFGRIYQVSTPSGTLWSYKTLKEAKAAFVQSTRLYRGGVELLKYGKVIDSNGPYRRRSRAELRLAMKRLEERGLVSPRTR